MNSAAIAEPTPSHQGPTLYPPREEGTHQGLRIEWQLCSPLVRGEFPLHLDGLLASVAFRRAQAANLDPWEARHALPLARARAAGPVGEAEWVFAASQVLFLDPVGPAATVTLTRRASISQIAKLIEQGVLVTGKSNIELGTGPDKSVLLHMQVQVYARAMAFCIGDQNEISEMLNRVTQLGGERRLGYGQIRDFSIIPDETALERWRWRTLPVSMRAWTGDDHFAAQATVRPDYFARDQREDCFEWNGTVPTDLLNGCHLQSAEESHQP